MHVAAQTDHHISAVDIPWRLTHLLHSKDYSKTRPLNTKFTNVFSIFGRLLFHYSIIHFSFSFCLLKLINYNYIHTINNKYQSEGSSIIRRERKFIQIGGRQRQSIVQNYEEILFMESPFETQEQRGDCAHFGETSREEMMQLRQKQNSGPLPKTALGD